jgi:hypothetical protein
MVGLRQPATPGKGAFDQRDRRTYSRSYGTLERVGDHLMDNDTIEKIMVTLGRLDERTERMEHDLGGNGQPGFRQRLEVLEASKNRMAGALAVCGAIGTGVWGLLEWVFHIRNIPGK